MDDFKSFIEERKSEGMVDGKGTFTIDSSRARHKLGRFRLEDPYEFIVRLAQAANLAAESLDYVTAPKGFFDIKDWDHRVRVITLTGWDPTFTLDKVVDSLVEPDFSDTDTPLNYLAVGLSTLHDHSFDGVDIVQRIEGERGVHHLRFSSGFQTSFKEGDEFNQDSSLRIAWSEPRYDKNGVVSQTEVFKYLYRASIFSRIPFTFEGSRSFLNDYRYSTSFSRVHTGVFSGTPDLHWHYFGPDSESLPRQLEEMVSEASYTFDKTVRSDIQRRALFTIDTSLTESMEVYFVRAGMVIGSIKTPSEIQGVRAYVDVDDFKTDLTGSKIIESEAVEELYDWLVKSSKVLIEPAIRSLEQIQAENKKPSKLQSLCIAFVVWILFYLWISGPMLYDYLVKMVPYSTPWKGLATVYGVSFLVFNRFQKVGHRVYTERKRACVRLIKHFKELR